MNTKGISCYGESNTSSLSCDEARVLMSSGKGRFVEKRKQLNLTQKQVADALGITSRTVQSWELGETVPRLTLDKTLLLCQVLHCTLEDLVACFYPPVEA